MTTGAAIATFGGHESYVFCAEKLRLVFFIFFTASAYIFLVSRAGARARVSAFKRAPERSLLLAG